MQQPARLRAAAIAALLSFASAGALAHEPKASTTIRLGEVETRVGRDDATLRAALRAAMTRGLAGLEFGRARPRGLVVSASLVSLESHAGDGVSLATAVVSATVRDAQGGTLEAIVEGHARAENDGRHLTTAELGAVAAAAHEAAVGIPMAVLKHR